MAIRAFLLVLVAALLSACASMPRDVSFVAPEITPADSATLAADTAQHLATALPPARTTLLLQPAKTDVLTAALLRQLIDQGFGVIEADPLAKGEQSAPSDAVSLRYLASPLDAGVVLRLQYQGIEASRYYPRAADGSLVTAAPFTVREAQ